LEIVGERPEKNHSLDRIDGKIGYTCGKCEQCKKMEWPMNLKWSTASEQSHNTKSNVWITIDGVRKLCSDWAKEMGRSYHYVRDNYKADD
jgi:hypothetical protein